MDSDAFKGSGRRLGSASESVRPTNSDPCHVDLAASIEGRNQEPTRLLFRLVPQTSTLTPVESKEKHPREISDAPSATTVEAFSVSDSSTTKKRKRRASTASTASLAGPAETSSAAEDTKTPVQKSVKGEEIIELLTDEDRQHWMKWLEKENDQIDPLQSLEVWYHDVRPQIPIGPSVVPTPRTELKKRLNPSDSLESHSDLLSTSLVPPKTGSLRDTIPGNFRNPSVLKTWCFGYPRERDIKLEELLQKDHLSGVVASMFVWDLDYWWSKINKNTTPCQFVMQRDSIQPGSRLQDGAHRVILHPENTKILHSKIMLLFFEELKELRLVLTTANMLPFDWGEMGGVMENMVFVIDFPKTRTQNLTQFGIDFSQYCLSLGLSTNIVTQLKEYDWEMTRDLIFVATHGQASLKELPYTGLAGLSQKLAQAGLTHDGELEIDYVSSSIGKVNWEFLSYLYQACKGKGSLPSPARCKNQCTPEELLNNVRVYFASQQTVDGSKGGPQAAARNLCFYPSVYQSLGEERKVFHDCVSRRPGCLMHSKIMFVQPKSANSSDPTKSQHAQSRRCLENPNWRSPIAQPAAEGTPAGNNADHKKPTTSSIAGQSSSTSWVYVGSANCSWAAWADPRNCRKKDEGYNTGSNWECGVIIPLRSLHTGQNLDHLDIFSTVIPVPIRGDAKSLHSQNRRPFFPSAHQTDDL